MSRNFTVKHGVRYPFYVSSPILKGRKTDVGSVTRISAIDLDAAILKALRNRTDMVDDDSPLKPRSIISVNVSCIVIGVIGPANVSLTLKPTADGAPSVVEIPWSLANRRERSHINDADDGTSRAPNQHLVQAVVRSHVWLKSLSNGTYKSVEEVARTARLHSKVIRNRIRLAFLAPDVTRAILLGTQPASMTMTELAELGAIDWRMQRRALNVGMESDRGDRYSEVVQPDQGIRFRSTSRWRQRCIRPYLRR